MNTPTPPRPRALLRARSERPCRRRAAEQRDELPPPHGLTLKPRATNPITFSNVSPVHYSKSAADWQLWVILVISAIPACPVSPKSGRKRPYTP